TTHADGQARSDPTTSPPPPTSAPATPACAGSAPSQRPGPSDPQVAGDTLHRWVSRHLPLPLDHLHDPGTFHRVRHLLLEDVLERVALLPLLEHRVSHLRIRPDASVRPLRRRGSQ